VDIVAVVAFNDPFVMSAWGKANRVRGNDIVRPHLCRFEGSILIFDSFSSPILMPSSQKALDGLMRHLGAQAAMPL
jgi:hypothetical protein